MLSHSTRNLTWNWNTGAWVAGDMDLVPLIGLSVYWSTTSYTPGVGVGIASGTWTRALPDSQVFRETRFA